MSQQSTVVNYSEFAESTVATAQQIDDATAKVALELKAEYEGKVSEDDPLVLICVLKGSYIFCADLSRALSDVGVSNVIEFICVSSYSGTQSTGEVRMLLDLRCSITDRHVLFVEDIIDTGRTLQYLMKVYKTRTPSSMKCLALLDKPEGRVVELETDFHCFKIPNKFVVGYGLDFDERFRDLRDVIILKPSVYTAGAKKDPRSDGGYIGRKALPERDYSEFAESTVATAQQIDDATAKVALELKAEYEGKVSEDDPLVLICVLKGSYIFCADLSRALSDVGVPNVIEFICVSSYSGTQSTGEVRMLLDLRCSITDRHVLFVEDIIDTGRTLQYLMKVYKTRTPSSMKCLALLDKPEGRVVELETDFHCFKIPNKFVVGYGLDFDERFRDLRDVIILKPSVYTADVPPYTALCLTLS